jgi:hypothetical protein
MVAFGKVTANKSGVKSRLIPGTTVWSGWSVTVRDSEVAEGKDGSVYNPFITRMLVKTLDKNIADKLIETTDSDAELVGYLKSENLAKKDEAPNFVQFFYVVDVK